MKGPWRITFDTNPDDCNLRCIMCEEFSPYSNLKQLRLAEGGTPKKRRMNIEIIENVLKQVTDKYTELKEIIPSTMGEPLLYKEFDQVIDLCKKYNVRLNLTTNGTFPRKSVREWAEKLMPILSDVKISWNGYSKEVQEKVMINSKMERRLKNLREFIDYRDKYNREHGHYATITLQVTFMEINYHEFPELVNMAIDFGVDRIKGHHLWVHFDKMRDQSMRRNRDSIRRWNDIVREVYKIVEKKRKKDGKKLKLENFFELDFDAPDRLLQDSECPFLGEEAWIAWDGRFNPCCAPDAQRKQLGDFGMLTERSFSEIWESQQYIHLKENYDNYSLCRSCNMRRKKE